MKKNSILIFALLSVFWFSLNTVSAQDVPDDPEERRVYYHLYWTLPEIEEAQKEVDAYTPESGNALYTYKGDDWGLLAVSRRARDEYSKTHDLTKWRQANPGNKFDAALDKLAASLVKKLPTDTARPNSYNVRPTPTLEKMMKETLKNLATLKLFKVGLYRDAWSIDKNDYGIPTARYVNGLIWARDPSDDHPYCRTYSVNIIQTYTGGGNYGGSYAVLVGEDKLAGCPAGAK